MVRLKFVVRVSEGGGGGGRGSRAGAGSVSDGGQPCTGYPTNADRRRRVADGRGGSGRVAAGLRSRATHATLASHELLDGHGTSGWVPLCRPRAAAVRAARTAYGGSSTSPSYKISDPKPEP